MYATQNGWTIDSMIKAVWAGNTGYVSRAEDGNGCAYRGAGGNKCAVGVFIPDDVYESGIEGMGAWGLLGIYQGLDAYMPLDNDAMDRLQTVHDSWGSSSKDDPRPRIEAWIRDNVTDK